MYFIRGKFLGMRTRNQSYGDNQTMVIHEAGVEIQRNNGFGGINTVTVYFKVPKSIHEDPAKSAHFDSFKGKHCNVEFFDMEREGKGKNAGKKFTDRYLGQNIEAVKA